MRAEFSRVSNGVHLTLANSVTKSIRSSTLAHHCSSEPIGMGNFVVIIDGTVPQRKIYECGYLGNMVSQDNVCMDKLNI